MKILVSCYACSPYMGSEPGMGWNFVNELSKIHELHIITEGKFEKDIRKYFFEHPEREGDFHFYFIWKKRHKTLRKIWPPSYYWFYEEWQKRAYRFGLELDQKENFDVIHQLNMATFRGPGYLWRIDKPFVWGPIGGLGITPWNMLHTMGIKGMLYYIVYNLINIWDQHTLVRAKRAMENASALIAATQGTHDQILKLYGRESTIIPEVGLTGSSASQSSLREPGQKLKLCWSGLHIPRKSLNLLLEAMAQCKTDKVELHVIGQGSETKKWKKNCECLGLKNVIWHGWVPREDALSIMQSCHLFCITSLSDLTSTVILEALSYGMPVITLDHCGFSNVINEECGRKIPILNHRQVTADFANAIDEIEADETLRRKLSEGARNRAIEYNWPDKAKIIDTLYHQVTCK